MDHTAEETHAGTDRPRFGRTFLILLGISIPGILTLIPTIQNQLNALPPEMLTLPLPVVALLSLINPLILTAVCIAAGVLLAHRVGLRSLIAEKVNGGAVWPQLRPFIPLAAALGLAYGVVVVGLDALINPFAGTEVAAETAALGDLLLNLLLGIFYGGIVEELMLRWGIMAILVWISWRVIQRGNGTPRPALVWAANILAALLFSLGHLPALAAMVPLTPLLVIRTVLLNAFGGILFGWLFWRRNLETAMTAHAATHVAFFVINVILLVIGR